MHNYDVRKHPVRRIRHDVACRILTAQHGHREPFAQRGSRLHTGYRHVQHIPRNHPHRLRRKLRGSSVPPRRGPQPRAAETGRRGEGELGVWNYEFIGFADKIGGRASRSTTPPRQFITH